MNDIEQKIREKIISNEYDKNYKLSENALAKEFCVSRTPIREALKNLESEGLIQIIAHSGTYIRHLDKNEQLNLLDVQEALETLAIKNLLNSSSKALHLLESELLKMIKKISISDFKAVSEIENNFHLLIIKLADNKSLLSCFSKLNIHLIDNPFNQKDLLKIQKEYLKLTALIKSNNQRALSVFSNQIAKKRAKIIEKLGEK